MRQLFSCFLFQTRPGDGLSPRRRGAFWLWNALLVTGAAVGLGLAGWRIFKKEEAKQPSRSTVKMNGAYKMRRR